ncbi:MAG: SCO family protein [Halofilum sp. (in: g-proteobacteria)]
MRQRAHAQAVLLVLAFSAGAFGHTGEGSGDRAVLDQVDFQQRIGGSLPPETGFLDADGQPRDIAALAADRPLALMMVWLDCPNLCPILLGETATSAANLPFPTEDYRVAVVSIVPEDGPADARQVRERLRQRHGETVANWHFLTGERAAIDRLAGAIGFEYAYDEADGTYAHPAGLVIAAPGGRVSSYLFGLRPEPGDLKLALVDAGEGQVGSATDQALLRCFRFDPETGQYTLAVMTLIQWIGGGFGLAMGGTIFWLWRRERQ